MHVPKKELQANYEKKISKWTTWRYDNAGYKMMKNMAGAINRFHRNFSRYSKKNRDSGH